MDPVENDVYVKLRDYFHLKLEARTLTGMDERETVSVLKFMLRVYDQSWASQNQESVGADAKRCLSCLNRMDLGYLASKVSDLTDGKKKIRLLGALISKTESRHNGRKNISAISLRLHQLDSKHNGPSRAVPTKPVAATVKKAPETVPIETKGPLSFMPILPTREIPRTPTKPAVLTATGKTNESTGPLPRSSPLPKNPSVKNVPHGETVKREKTTQTFRKPVADGKSTEFQPILPTREIPRTPMVPAARSRHNDTYTVDNEDLDRDLRKEGPVDTSTPVNSSKEKNESDGTFTVSKSPEIFVADAKAPLLVQLDGTFTKSAVETTARIVRHEKIRTDLDNTVVIKGKPTFIERETPLQLVAKPQSSAFGKKDPSTESESLNVNALKATDVQKEITAAEEKGKSMQPATKAKTATRDTAVGRIDPVTTGAAHFDENMFGASQEHKGTEEKAVIFSNKELGSSENGAAQRRIDPAPSRIHQLVDKHVQEENEPVNKAEEVKTQSSNGVGASMHDQNAARMDISSSVLSNVSKKPSQIRQKPSKIDAAAEMNPDDHSQGSSIRNKDSKIDPVDPIEPGSSEAHFQEGKDGTDPKPQVSTTVERSESSANLQDPIRIDSEMSNVDKGEERKICRGRKPKQVENNTVIESQSQPSGAQESRINFEAPAACLPTRKQFKRGRKTKPLELTDAASQAFKTPGSPETESRIDPETSRVDRAKTEQPRGSRKMKVAKVESLIPPSVKSDLPPEELKGLGIDPDTVEVENTTKKQRRVRANVTPEDPMKQTAAESGTTSSARIDPEPRTAEIARKKPARKGRKGEPTKQEEYTEGVEDGQQRKSMNDSEEIRTDDAVQKPLQRRKRAAKDAETASAGLNGLTSLSDDAVAVGGSDAQSEGFQEGPQIQKGSADSEAHNPPRKTRGRKRKGDVSSPIVNEILKSTSLVTAETTDTMESANSGLQDSSAKTTVRSTTRKVPSQPESVLANSPDLEPFKEVKTTKSRITRKNPRIDKKLLEKPADPSPQDVLPENEISTGFVSTTDPRLVEDHSNQKVTSAVLVPVFAHVYESADSKPAEKPKKTRGRTTKKKDQGMTGQLLNQSADLNPQDRTPAINTSPTIQDPPTEADPQETADSNPLSDLPEKKTNSRTKKSPKPRVKRSKKELPSSEPQESAVSNPPAPKNRSRKRRGSADIDASENNPTATSTNQEARKMDDVTEAAANQKAAKTPAVSKRTRNAFVLAFETSTPTLKVVPNPARKNRRKVQEESPVAAFLDVKSKREPAPSVRSAEKGPGSPAMKELSLETDSVKPCTEAVVQRPRRGRKPLKSVDTYDADDAEVTVAKRKRPTRR